MYIWNYVRQVFKDASIISCKLKAQAVSTEYECFLEITQHNRTLLQVTTAQTTQGTKGIYLKSQIVCQLVFPRLGRAGLRKIHNSPFHKE